MKQVTALSCKALLVGIAGFVTATSVYAQSYSDTAGDKAEMLFVKQAELDLAGPSCSWDIGPSPKELAWYGDTFKFYAMRIKPGDDPYVIKVNMKDVGAIKLANDNFITTINPDDGTTQMVNAISTYISFDDDWRPEVNGDHPFYDHPFIKTPKAHKSIKQLDTLMTGTFELPITGVTVFMGYDYVSVPDDFGLSYSTTLSCYTD